MTLEDPSPYEISVAALLLVVTSNSWQRHKIRSFFPEGAGSNRGNRISIHLNKAYKVLETGGFIRRDNELIRILDRPGLEELVLAGFKRSRNVQHVADILLTMVQRYPSYRTLNPMWIQLNDQVAAASAEPEAAAGPTT